MSDDIDLTATLNPCGLIMDYMRSCYECDMVFREGDNPVRVQWYFVDEDAECFPGHHRFGSQNWIDTKINLSIGEQVSPRIWRDGSKPQNGGTGDTAALTCAESEEWQQWFKAGIGEGQETGPYTPDGLPECCIDPCSCTFPDDWLFTYISNNPCASIIQSFQETIPRVDGNFWEKLVENDERLCEGCSFLIQIACDSFLGVLDVVLSWDFGNGTGCSLFAQLEFECGPSFDLLFFGAEMTGVNGEPCPCNQPDNFFQLQGNVP